MWLATAHGTITLWDVTGTRPVELARIEKFAVETSQLAFGPDGRSLVAANCDNRVCCWDLTDARRPAERHPLASEQQVFFNHGFADALLLPGNGRALFAADIDGHGRAWSLDGATPKALASLPRPSFPFGASPDGKRVWCTDWLGDLTDLVAWDVSRTPPEPEFRQQAHTAAITPDGRTAVVDLRDRTLRLLDAAREGAEGTSAVPGRGEARLPPRRLGGRQGGRGRV
jgi:WD40 repeat protein